MISTTKSFGSYALVRNDLFTGTEYQEDSYCSDCAIPGCWTELSLVGIRAYNDDTSLFTFQLPAVHEKLNLPIGGYLLALAPGCEHGGGDAVRPYTSVFDGGDAESYRFIDPKLVANTDDSRNTFTIMCKRYDQWGKKESIETHFLFTRTDHSYRPPGAVSNYLHSLRIGDKAKFKHTSLCKGKINYPFEKSVKTITMIAVGAGIAPMIQTLRAIFANYSNGKETGDVSKCNITGVVLMYGARTVKDLLLRELLELWEHQYPELFKVVFCVGSRWVNVHMGAKAKDKGEYKPPSLPEGFESLTNVELGWVNEDKIRKHGFPANDSTRVIVCGLPGVYEKLCGYRQIEGVVPNTILHSLGYQNSMVIKL